MNDKSGERRRQHDVVQLKIIVQLLVQYKKNCHMHFGFLACDISEKFSAGVVTHGRNCSQGSFYRTVPSWTLICHGYWHCYRQWLRMSAARTFTSAVASVSGWWQTAPARHYASLIAIALSCSARRAAD